jgi:UrcA family protein
MGRPASFSIPFAAERVHQHAGSASDGPEREEEYLPMKTLNSLKIYAAPVALLLMAGGLAAPSASARPAASVIAVEARFAFDRTAPAEKIYADLSRVVDRMCRTPGPHALIVRKSDQSCVQGAMRDGLAKIGRADLAQLHTRTGG